MNLFNLQMENNPIYSAYAKIILKGKNPNNINEIPFLPIEFFKTEQIICTGQKIEEIFLSSGTTGNQSKHLISDLEIYKAVLFENAKRPALRRELAKKAVSNHGVSIKSMSVV